MIFSRTEYFFNREKWKGAKYHLIQIDVLIRKEWRILISIPMFSPLYWGFRGLKKRIPAPTFLTSEEISLQSKWENFKFCTRNISLHVLFLLGHRLYKSFWNILIGGFERNRIKGKTTTHTHTYKYNKYNYTINVVPYFLGIK